ncbi:hypothetical protein AFLA_013004 [Aspergillus flavus NRRL3357]|nr:hypothetical protein AFLA_013004 [Aspergillus flavus NRRL3357]
MLEGWDKLGVEGKGEDSDCCLHPIFPIRWILQTEILITDTEYLLVSNHDLITSEQKVDQVMRVSGGYSRNCQTIPDAQGGITAANTIYSVWFNLCFRYTPIHIHICKASASYPALPSCLLQ